MLRAAAKNHESVAVAVDPRGLRRSARGAGRRTPAARRRDAFAPGGEGICAHRALRHHGRELSCRADRNRRRERFPATLPLVFDKVQDLRYGENPHQQAALYREPMAREPSVATRAGAAGQRPVVQQHRGRGHGHRVRPAIRAAGLRHRQARQSVRRGRGRLGTRSLRQALPHRPNLGVRRHHRSQSGAGRCPGRRHSGAAVRRSARGAFRSAGRTAGSRRQAQRPGARRWRSQQRAFQRARIS